MKKSLLITILFVLISCFLFASCQTAEEPEHIHNWKQADCTTPKTCAECGTTEGEAIGHSWEEINYAMTCTHCKEIDETVNIPKPPLFLDPAMDDVSKQAYLNLNAQNNTQNEATFCIQDGWVYGQSWTSSGSSLFIKVRTDFSDWTVLDNGFAQHITVIDNYIYYSLYKSSDEYGIYRMRTSGEGREQLVKASGAMQVVGDYIYFTDHSKSDSETETPAYEYAHLYRCNLDGSDVVAIIAKPVFYFHIFDNGILYQDDQDNESLHACHVDGTGEVKLNNQVSYYPIYDGEYIYYVGETGGGDNYTRSIWRMRYDGSDNKMLAQHAVSNGMILSNDHIYFVYGDDSDRLYRMNKDGSRLTLITQDPYIAYIQLLGENIKYTRYEKNYRYIDENMFCNLDGSGKWVFKKQ